MARKLTPKQARFVEEYLIDLNATQAAIRAGYSERTARFIAAENLSKPNIAAAIEVVLAERSEKTAIDAEWVLRRLVIEAEADVADLYDADGNLKPVHDWPEIWRKGLVAGIDVEITGGDWPVTIKKLRLSDRLKRIELIGKHVDINAFKERVEIDGVSDLAARLERAHRRLDEQERNERGQVESAEGSNDSAG